MESAPPVTSSGQACFVPRASTSGPVHGCRRGRHEGESEGVERQGLGGASCSWRWASCASAGKDT